MGQIPGSDIKRWIKEVGQFPFSGDLTEQHPMEAIKTVFSRCAFILFGFSVLVIKYFPDLGRDYSSHSGMVQVRALRSKKTRLEKMWWCLV